MNKSVIFFLGMLTAFLIIAALIAARDPFQKGYKDGQIDCLNNQIYYELQKQDDGTTEWIYVPEGVK